MAALVGADANAVISWLEQPAQGAMLADCAKLPLVAGAVANGIYVTVFEALNVKSSTFEQDCRDVCVDSGLMQRSFQNIFRDWVAALKIGAGTTVNLPSQINLVVRAGVRGGATVAETERSVR